MSTPEIAAALQRVEAVLRKRPAAGRHADAPALVRWDGGLRTVARHDNGTEVATDMPAEIGGGGGVVTPGWLLRAALASCTVTRVAMAAAAEGITLDTLEARATSTSDSRGLLGMAEADGQPVPVGPDEVALHVRIGAAGVAPERLRELVQACSRCAPVTSALQQAVPVALHVEVAAG